jgi:hypothetical protein
MMCSSLRVAVLAGSLISIHTLAASGLAAPSVFFARDDDTMSMTSFPNSLAKFNQFTASLNSFGVDDIESHFGANPSLSFGPTGIQATTQGVFATSTPGFNLTIDAIALTESENAVGGPAANPVFAFNQNVTAFGMYVINGGDIQNNDPNSNSNPITFRLTDTVANTSVDVPIQVGPGWNFHNVFFLGVTDTTPFNEVTVIETNDAGDGILFDNVVAGQIPEPTSLVLAALGGAWILGASNLRRRR